MTTVARLKIKEIGRNLRKQWRMVFNSTVHAKSYLLKKYYVLGDCMIVKSSCCELSS